MPDPIVIAGHKCERGSEAERLLREADMYLDWSAIEDADGWNDDAQQEREVAAEYVGNAINAPGYLGPATDMETTDGR